MTKWWAAVPERSRLCGFEYGPALTYIGFNEDNVFHSEDLTDRPNKRYEHKAIEGEKMCQHTQREVQIQLDPQHEGITYSSKSEVKGIRSAGSAIVANVDSGKSRKRFLTIPQERRAPGEDGQDACAFYLDVVLMSLFLNLFVL